MKKILLILFVIFSFSFSLYAVDFDCAADHSKGYFHTYGFDGSTRCYSSISEIRVTGSSQMLITGFFTLNGQGINEQSISLNIDKDFSIESTNIPLLHDFILENGGSIGDYIPPLIAPSVESLPAFVTKQVVEVTIVGCLVLSLMLSPILLRRLWNFLVG
ncbi:MAG: hypothetical protein ACRCST_16145 [Turicibacter sp.]